MIEAGLYLKLFPKLATKRWAKITLSDHAWYTENNPRLDPVFCNKWIQQLHSQHNCQFSFGGYGENRANLWRGSYLKPESSWHLGIDYNVPAGTPVSAVKPGTVIDSWADPDQDGGWGGRVIIGCQELCVVYAHLAKDSLPGIGTAIDLGDIVGKIGRIEENGHWYEHLHVQCVIGSILSFDGYGKYKDIQNFPDPENLFYDD